PNNLQYIDNKLERFFFFQAEDGIRDRNVTGVQTCALPIYLISARWRPNTFSSASEISPTVALARAASIASASRLPLPSSAERVSAASAASTSFWFRSFFKRPSLSICKRRTVEFSTLSTSIGFSFFGLYLLTPITAWRPASIRAWVLADASSMRSLG